MVRELLGELRTRTDINWAFLSPAVMFAIYPVSFEKTGTYRIGQDDVLTNADGSPADISVADLAVAIADDIEQKAHLHDPLVYHKFNDFKDKMIDLAEEIYGVDIKKKFSSKPSSTSGSDEKNTPSA